MNLVSSRLLSAAAGALLTLPAFFVQVQAGSEEQVERAPLALVTGSTRGLGAEVARRLGAKGYHVIVHGRSVERGQAVVASIKEAGGSGEFRRADFLSLNEVRELAFGILDDFQRLDLLVNNAGIGSDENGRLVSADGLEPVFQVNYLAHFLLTELLVPMMLDAAPARIVNVSSGAQTAIDFDDLMLEHWEPDGRQIGRPYAQSKLAQILHTYDIAERLEGAGIAVNALHPATFMDTYMVRQAGIEPRATVDEGADRVMQLIVEDVGSGHYFVDGEPARAHEQAYDEAARLRLRELSLELIGHGG
ncbi:MAG: SDR family NAD(P)-dependent oxidoreductase [Wenzhouxiangella sp.]|nr:SDR family NAD(P)-dependent oxidoreductase [Wenzhouxiangella sp.]TVR97280.1 MAG: SDR family NAD(P)-dependent oxidoreductase [Wenzhouxiangellaceae bacterium]